MLFCVLLNFFISRTLKDNEYNHITATYYLLAESIIRNKKKLNEATNKNPEASKIKNARYLFHIKFKYLAFNFFHYYFFFLVKMWTEIFLQIF